MCACKSEKDVVTNKAKDLENLGYSENAIANVLSLSEKNQSIFLESYSKNKESLIVNKDFKEEYLADYIKYLNVFDLDTTLYLVNNAFVDRLNTIDVYELYKDKFFIKENIELYLEYKDNFEETRDLIEWVNCKCYKEYFKDPMDSDPSLGPLVIVSKIYYLGEYEPNDLVDVDTKYAKSSDWQLRKEAYENYIEMYEAAKKDKMDFYITSAYRSYKYQIGIYNRYLQTDSQARVDSYSARPGYSDHQSGYTVDILKDGYSFDTFKYSDEAKWLNDNAYKYGFVLRYPEDKQEITGYIPESWHFRYVGKEAAKIVKENDITFDEYYAYYVENK